MKKRFILFCSAILILTSGILTFQHTVYANGDNNDNVNENGDIDPETLNYFDVTSQEFGAIPNDETDDFLAINNALGKAKEIDETITVYIPEGEYIISHQLYIYSNTKLILDENAVIKSNASDDFIVMIMGENADQTTEHGEYTRIENVEISGGTWDRNSSSDTISCVFVLHHGNNINIHDLTVKNCTDHMINVSADKDVTVKNVVFQNQIPYTGTSKDYWDNFDVGDTERHVYTEAIHMDFAGEGEQGAIPLDNTSCDNITIDGCTFNGVLAGAGTHHESNYKAKNVTVTNCEFTNVMYGAAINAWSFENLTVTNNTVTCPKTCITAIDSTMSISKNNFDILDSTGASTPQFAIRIIKGQASISENTINGSSKSAIKVDETTELNITDNTLSNIAKCALDLVKCKESINVKSNQITALQNADTLDVAIYLEKLDADTTIEGNTISGEFKHHAFLNESDATLKSNILSSSKIHTIYSYNSNSQIISNQIINAGENAVYVLNGEATITGNTIENAQVNGIRVDQISNVIANNNIINNAENHGIHISNTTNGSIISNNEITGSNEKTGIYLNQCNEENLIEKNKIRCGTVAGIYAMKSSGTISENNVQECSGDALQTVGDENNFTTFEIKGNTFKTTSTSNYDINLNSNSRNCKLSNNTFGNRGIRIASGVTYSFIGMEGLTKIGETYYYINNGVIDNTYTGLVDYNNSKYYVKNGVFNRGINSLVQDNNGTWYYVTDSVLNANYTGLVEYYGAKYYIQNGILHWGETGLRKIDGIWYYVKNSTFQNNYTGLVQHNNSWFYVQKGELKWGVRTLVQYYGTWYYVSNSTLDWNYTGLCNYNGAEYYIQKGVLKWGVSGLTNISGTWCYLKNSTLQSNYTNLVPYNNSWFYVQKGILKWGVKTLVNYGGTWYYVSNSTLNWNYTGLCEYYGAEYYIQKGVLKWGVSGLTNIGGTWYYLKNSTLQSNYTNLVQYNNSWFYVQKGILKWGVRTLVKYYDTWYYVNNSTLDWNFTGLCPYNGTDYYIQKGVLKWGYNGNIVYNGKTYRIKNSMVSK